MLWLVLWGALALGCAVWNGRAAREHRALAVVMGLLLGPAGVWLFPRRRSPFWKAVAIVALGCAALLLLGLLLTLARMP